MVFWFISLSIHDKRWAGNKPWFTDSFPFSDGSHLHPKAGTAKRYTFFMLWSGSLREWNWLSWHHWVCQTRTVLGSLKIWQSRQWCKSHVENRYPSIHQCNEYPHTTCYTETHTWVSHHPCFMDCETFSNSHSISHGRYFVPQAKLPPASRRSNSLNFPKQIPLGAINFNNNKNKQHGFDNYHYPPQHNNKKW